MRGSGSGTPWDSLRSSPAVMAAFVSAVRSTSDAGRARSAAAFFAAIAGGVGFWIIYQVVQGIGFGVSVSLGNRRQFTELDRTRNPVGYWVFVLVGLILAGTTIAGA